MSAERLALLAGLAMAGALITLGWHTPAMGLGLLLLAMLTLIGLISLGCLIAEAMDCRDEPADPEHDDTRR